MPAVSETKITIIAGENWLRIKKELDRQVDAFIKQYGELAVEKIDGSEAELDEITGVITTQPFLIEKKLCVLYDLSKNKKAGEAVEQIIQLDVPSTEIILVEGKLDKRSFYYKTLKKQSGFKEYQQLDEDSTVSWLAEEAKHLGGKLSRSDAQYLYSRVGGDQSRLSNELIKLIDFDKTISRQNIDKLTEPMPSSTIFDLLNAAFSGDVKRAINLYDDQRLQKVEPGQILAMLGWQMRVVALVKSARGTPQNDLAKQASINPFVIQKSRKIASKLDRQQVKDVLSSLVNIDSGIKNKNLNGDDAIKNLLVSIARSG